MKSNKYHKIKGGENTVEQEERPEHLEDSKPLNKEQVQKVFAAEGEDDYMDSGYDPEADPIPVVIFDSELQFIQELKAVDIVFLLDSTASMSPFMKGTKRFYRKLWWDAQKCWTQYLVDEIDVLKVGLVTYKDHDQEQKSFVTQIDCDLTSDFTEFTQALMKVKAQGGADEAEAVWDGWNEAVSNISWRDKSFKFIYHVCDGPAHGSALNTLPKDDYQDCPCGLNYEDILTDMRGKEIEYTIVKLSNTLDTMIEAFSQVCKVEVMNPEIKADKSKAISQYE